MKNVLLNIYAFVLFFVCLVLFVPTLLFMGMNKAMDLIEYPFKIWGVK